MIEQVKAAVLAFIKSIQAMDPHQAGQHTLQRRVDKSDGEGWETVIMSLTFGQGYFDPGKVWVSVGDYSGVIETEEAVAAYCEGRMPKTGMYQQAKPTEKK